MGVENSGIVKIAPLDMRDSRVVSSVLSVRAVYFVIAPYPQFLGTLDQKLRDITKQMKKQMACKPGSVLLAKG